MASRAYTDYFSQSVRIAPPHPPKRYMYRALNENVLEKAEIQSAYLQDSFAIQQKIRSLQVAVNDPVVVQVMDASQ